MEEGSKSGHRIKTKEEGGPYRLFELQILIVKQRSYSIHSLNPIQLIDKSIENKTLLMFNKYESSGLQTNVNIYSFSAVCCSDFLLPILVAINGSVIHSLLCTLYVNLSEL